eukprot:819638-Pelagomonas_calceolata.AAC.2
MQVSQAMLASVASDSTSMSAGPAGGGCSAGGAAVDCILPGFEDCLFPISTFFATLIILGNVPARPSKTTSSSQEGTKKHMLLHQLFPHTARTSHIHSHPTRLTSNVVRRRTVSALTRAAGTGSSSTAANSTADVSKDYFQGDSRPIILYDGVCNL